MNFDLLKIPKCQHVTSTLILTYWILEPGGFCIKPMVFKLLGHQHIGASSVSIMFFLKRLQCLLHQYITVPSLCLVVPGERQIDGIVGELSALLSIGYFHDVIKFNAQIIVFQ